MQRGPYRKPALPPAAPTTLEMLAAFSLRRHRRQPTLPDDVACAREWDDMLAEVVRIAVLLLVAVATAALMIHFWPR